MSENADKNLSVPVNADEVSEVKEQPEKTGTKNGELPQIENDSHDVKFDLQMQQLSADLENHLKNVVTVTIESGEATLRKSEDDHIPENNDDASTANSINDSIDNSTSDSTQESTNDTKIPIDDNILYIDDNIESTEEISTSKDELINDAKTVLSQTKLNHDFVEITVDNEEFVEIPLNDMTESDIKNTATTGDQNVDDNGYITIPSKKNPEEFIEQTDGEEEESISIDEHSKWYYITWTFTIVVMVIIFVSICGLGYFFSKGKKAYPPPIDEKTAYLQAYNITNEDYEIDVHNNRSLARQMYPWNPYLWLPEPPSSAILG